MKLETSEGERAEFRKWFEDRSLSIIPRSFVPDSIWAHALRLLRDIDTLLAEVERLRKEYELAGEQLDELEAEAEASTVEIANLRAELDRAPLLPAEVEETIEALRSRYYETPSLGELVLIEETTIRTMERAASLLSRWPGVWRPIETAPKDGKVVWLRWGGKPVLARFKMWPASQGVKAGGTWLTLDAPMPITHVPDAWSPLPEPPHE